MRFRCTVMEISSFPNYLVCSIKRLPTPKANKIQSPKLRLTQSLLVATLTQNFMRFRCTVMEISSIPRYLVYSIKRLPTPKVNKLQSPKLRLTQVTIGGYIHSEFHVIPLHGYGDFVYSKIPRLFHQKASYAKSKQATEPQT